MHSTNLRALVTAHSRCVSSPRSCVRYVPRCEASTSNSTPTDTNPVTGKKLAVLKASKQAAQPVRELQDRTLGMPRSIIINVLQSIPRCPRCPQPST